MLFIFGILGSIIIMNLLTAVALKDIDDLDSKADTIILEHIVNGLESENRLRTLKLPNEILIPGDRYSTPPKV